MTIVPMVEPDHGADGLVLQANELHYAVIDTRSVELPDDSWMTVFEDAPGPNEVGIQDVRRVVVPRVQDTDAHRRLVDSQETHEVSVPRAESGMIVSMRWMQVGGGLVLSAVLVACGNSSTGGWDTVGSDPWPPLESGGFGSTLAEVFGELSLEQDGQCLFIESDLMPKYLLVPPHGSHLVRQQGSGDLGILFPDGQVVELGSSIEGAGSYYETAQSDDEIAVYHERCGSLNTDVAILSSLDDVQPIE